MKHLLLSATLLASTPVWAFGRPRPLPANLVDLLRESQAIQTHCKTRLEPILALAPGAAQSLSTNPDALAEPVIRKLLALLEKPDPVFPGPNPATFRLYQAILKMYPGEVDAPLTMQDDPLSPIQAGNCVDRETMYTVLGMIRGSHQLDPALKKRIARLALRYAQRELESGATLFTTHDAFWTLDVAVEAGLIPADPGLRSRLQAFETELKQRRQEHMRFYADNLTFWRRIGRLDRRGTEILLHELRATNELRPPLERILIELQGRPPGPAQ